MDLVSMILGLPFAPIRGVIALGEVVQEQVDQELRGSIRRELEAGDAEENSGAERVAVQRRVVRRATARREPARM
jgi:hypothetical protein